MMRSTMVLFFLSTFLCAAAQEDSIRSMKEVTVRGFETNTEQIRVPASVSVIGSRDLQRFGNVSLVPVMNTVAGVRMEERSPGSYRLSIRGSLLRSPFGVRNVKVYWKDIPLTDAGGNTYLNLIDFNGVGGVEILKGPAGSLYGAGTGGVVTLREPSWKKEDKPFLVQLNGGSFGTFGAAAKWQAGTENLNWQVMQSHFQSDGYRQNSRMRRDVTQGTMTWRSGTRNTLEALLFYSNLAYRTPGGLTLAQMNADPTQSRPATAVLPSAVQQKAGIYNRTLLAGLTNTYQFSEHWKNTTTIAGTFTDFENPFITNYETRKENGISLRTRINYARDWGRMRLQWIGGAEMQVGRSRIDSTGNRGGEPDNNLVRDRLRVAQQFLFTQAELEFSGRFKLQAGLSYNTFNYTLQREIPAQAETDLDFDAQLLPRVALLYMITPDIAIHASASKGYSAPGLAEIRPSAGGINSGLQAEYGWNYEAGLKGSLWRNRLNVDITAFQFNLRDAIVRRVNAAGAEYFINAGGTEQKGIELFAELYMLNRASGSLRQIRIWGSGTIYDFVFSNYKVNNNDYSGNDLTGVPRRVVVAGLDLSMLAGVYLNATFNYTSRLPLTDANDAFAGDYRLWQIRLGWKQKWKNGWGTDLFIGVDNAGDAMYSLGNDINAFGRRYYNPAPERNFYAGVRVAF